MTADGGPPRFGTVPAYNSAYPGQPIPVEPNERNGLRGYHAAMTGVEDDITGAGVSLTVDFLPGGAPTPDEPDRLGNVVATHWGQAPIIVLAEAVSLRDAWKAVIGSWPARLSEAITAVAALPSYSGTDT
ncbi:hypothetical protein [Qaidamihabitans albus]|uniref:hypothetical protein n=1 Tax=Qaidamihabitans albus TaxID=2795733 RepID=UPI0018F1D7E9|nr:hypothetical protein [Qaidamihabitans albus]